MLGIIGAMNTEVETLISALSDKQETVIAGSRFYSGKLGSTDAVVVMCGIGKVAAAICAQAMIDHYHPTILINTGVAGGIASGLAQGDLVIATDAVQHDFDLRYFGYAKGYMPSYGKNKDRPSGYPMDSATAQRLLIAAEKLGYHAIRGRIVSGDIFVSDSTLKKALAEEFNASAAEMEGASIAQVAYQNCLPCAILRAISDLADEEATLSYAEFEQIAAERSATLLLEICK